MICRNKWEGKNLMISIKVGTVIAIYMDNDLTPSKRKR